MSGSVYFRGRVGVVIASLLLASVIGRPPLAQGISDNDAVVEQVGSDNEALIEQVGSFNRAGSDDEPLFQEGIFNDIDILQQGRDNRIGLTAPGVTQTGLQNTDQIFNRIQIEQTANLNTVGSITQTSEGSVVNGANTLIIRQGGGGNNTVEVVRQTQEDGQAAQVARIEQTGEFNRVALIDQLANSNAFGEDNIITLRIIGVRNGQTGLSGFAAIQVVVDSGIIQENGNGDLRANGNRVDMLIAGDDNRFGIRQGGRMNDVGFITVDGDANQLGLRQDGTENDISIAPIEGDDNIIGIDQLGTNRADITLEAITSGNALPRSDRNQILIQQDGTSFISLEVEGDDNEFTANQDFDARGLGGDNTARVRLIGNGNIGRLTQFGTNVFDLDLEGNDNNALSFDGSFDALGQVVGTFSQTGDGNTADITVRGDANRFGFTQTGDQNSMLATIFGAQNQLALAQLGSNNAAFLNQSGNGNRMSVVQN